MKRSFMIISFFLFMLPVPNIHADTSKNPLILGTVSNLPPYEYMVKGKLEGIDIDLVREMAERMGIEVRIRDFPWARIMLLLKDGEIDGAFSAFMLEERKRFCLYTEILHQDELGLVVRKDRRFQFTRVSDLYGKTIGKGRSVSMGEAFDRAFNEGKINVEEVDDMNMSNIRKLDAGRLDAVAGSIGAMLFYAKKLGVEKNIVPLDRPLKEKVPAYLVLSKKSPLKNKVALQNEMIKVLKKMKEDGTYRKVYMRYGVIYPEHPE